jgi:hypothetical protein
MLVPRGTGQPWWKPCLALPWRRGFVGRPGIRTADVGGKEWWC